MASIVFSVIGSAIGSQIGGTVLGVAASTIGQTIGGIAGGLIDKALLAPGGAAGTNVTGPRLSSLAALTAVEGAGIPYGDGRFAVAGEIIWATYLQEEVITTTTPATGGKAFGGGGGTAASTTTEYRYKANFAVGLLDCFDQPVRHFGRVWADGKILDLSDITVRFYKGTETQVADPFIVAKEGDSPAYLGTAYVVFEGLPIDQFGRRVPQLFFEMWGPSGTMEEQIKGVDIIPGSTEFGYHPTVVTQTSLGSFGEIVEQRPENAHRFKNVSDWTLSMDMLQGTLPNVATAALIVAWFGDDLRAGVCQITPRVETTNKTTSPITWVAAGLNRQTATVVSQKDGRPAFGSSPADDAVIEAIRDLKARGLRVVMYPFILMDIPADNTLPHPDGVQTSQPENPWRGRITPDTAETVADEVTAFLGTAQVSDFSVANDVVTYTGSGWGFRRFILHLAHLASAAGGVDAMLIGSEMVAMTTATEAGSGVYPFVDGLVTLAADVKTVLPSADVSYAADWSEYHSHRPASGDVFFHLDPLWSSADVDFIGIDNYLPLSDWRDGTEHLDYDAANGITSEYYLDYLKANIEAGEYFDWFYASDADRDSQTRTTITDGAYGEPWVFQQKAIRAWHGNAHHNRPAGVRDASSTAWTASSKPIWFTEFGCPAVNRGANQPNVFVSQSSSESALPHHSSGTRDDFMQRQYTRAMLEWWGDNGGSIVSTDDMLLWSWDARPWPEFPTNTGTWADGPDWTLGHWLNGRAGNAPAAEALSRRLTSGFNIPASDLDFDYCFGQADGYPLTDPIDFRGYAQAWEVAFGIEGVEDGSKLAFRSRPAAITVATITPDDMIDQPNASRFKAERKAPDTVAKVATLRYLDGGNNYENAPARAEIEVGPEVGEAEAASPLVMDIDRATAAAEVMVRAAADGRETVSFALPLSFYNVRPGRLITLELDPGEPLPYIVNSVSKGSVRKVQATSFESGSYAPTGGSTRTAPGQAVVGSTLVTVVFLDLPLLADATADDWRGYLAGHASPWPGGADVYRSPDADTGYSLNRTLITRSAIGETKTTLDPGRLWRWSGETVDVQLYSGTLVDRPDLDVLDGANAIAVEHPGGWEILQFAKATLIDAQTWRLSRLLRGQRGTEGVRASTALAAGARVVVLDTTVQSVAMAADDIGRAYYWRYGPTAGDPDGDTFQQTGPLAFNGAGRRPFAPHQLRAVPQSNGDWVFTWVRRSRIEGDVWPGEAAEVPLGEASELYRLKIMNGSTVLRTVDITTPTWTYPSATQAADGLPATFDVDVAQVSDTFGPGTSAVITVEG